MKKILLLIVVLLQVAISRSQTIQYVDDDAPDRDSTEAEALPWFGNNQYLLNLLDSIGYNNTSGNRIITSDIAKYKVPIKFWVYRRSDGTGGANLRDLRNYIDNLNRIFNVDNRTLIGFYLRCDIGFINSDDNFNIDGDGEAWNLIQNNKSRGGINIHIVGDYVDTRGIHIRARFFGRDGIVLNFAATGGGVNTTIAHEIGHYFELDHTHQYSSRGKCRKESVDRNRTWPTFGFCPFGGSGPTNQRICEATGDLLEDTPADPNLSNNFFNTTGACSFNAQGSYNGTNDAWGDSYVNPPAGSVQPNTRNVMSYNRDRDCRIIFSRLQIAVMIYSIERGKSKGNCTEWKDLKGEYDNFEMDNFSEAARPINFGITQEHNFHQQYQGDGIWAQCDEDWVRFIAPCNINANIITSAISSRPNANTRLTLFNTAMTQLAQNDNISPTNLFSSINWTFVAGQEYFIRVENMNQVGTTYYTLQIGGNLTLLGDDNVCTTSNNYFMSNLPAGSGIVWTATPANIVTVNSPNSLQTTLTKITDGTITLTATVALCGAQQAIFRKSLAVGVSITPRTIYGIPDNYNNCQNSIFNVTSGGSGSFTWEVLGGQILSGQGGSEINIQLNNSPGNGFYIGLKENNVCGTSRVLGTKQGTIIYCDGGGGNTTTRISPNPTTGQTTISLVSDSKDLEIKEVRIKNKMGRIFVIQKFSNLKQKTIDLSTLPNDVYIVDVFDGKKWNSHKIIVQK